MTRPRHKNIAATVQVMLDRNQAIAHQRGFGVFKCLPWRQINGRSVSAAEYLDGLSVVLRIIS